MDGLPVCRAIAADASPWWWQRAHWLYAAIQAGELDDHDGKGAARRLELSVVSLGSLTLGDGRLVVADPYLMGPEPAPIAQTLRAGRHRVAVARAQVGPDHERIAAAALLSDAETFVDWQMARWPGQDPATLNGEGFFGYGVDAGTGCFGSPRAASVAGRVLSEDAGMLEDPMSKALFANNPAAGAAVVAPEDGSEPIAIFSSGWGDGVYPTWLGVDSGGEVVVAVTDFLLTGDPFAAPELEAAPTPPTSRPSWWKRLSRG